MSMESPEALDRAGAARPDRPRPHPTQCHAHTLARDGQRPVCFEGVLLAQALGASDSGEDCTAWAYYDLSLYHTEQGDYLGHWEYTTTWPGERCHHEVTAFDNLAGALAAFATFQPAQWVARQDHESAVRERYHAQVAALCAELDMGEER